MGGWIWSRHRGHFVLLLGVVVVVVVNVGVSVPATAIGAVYLDLSFSEFALVFAGNVAMSSVAVGVTTWRLRGETAPIRVSAAGEECDLGDVWLALVRFPQQLAWGVFVCLAPLCFATTLPFFVHVAEVDWRGTVALVLAYLIVVGSAGALIATIAQLLVRRAASEVTPRDAFAGQLRGSWTVRRRLVVSSFVVVSIVAVGGPLLVQRSGLDEGDFLTAVIGALLVSGYVTLVLDAGVFRPTMVPVADLIDGTARVVRGDLSQLVPVSSLDELGDLSIAFNEMQRGLAQREVLHAAFGSYVDPLLAQRLLDSGSSMFDGENLNLTVLFADVRDFTSYSEGVDPSTAVQMLNDLFDVVIPVIHTHGGHVNHYLGDGLLAVFGAPQPLPGHADAAVAAAAEVQRQVRAHLGADLRLGIGINTGPVIAGTVGGGGRHEFTVIGDTVNTSARVEQLTKDTGDSILITEATRLALSTPRPRSTKRGEFEVRGKVTKLTLHAINPFPRSTR